MLKTLLPAMADATGYCQNRVQRAFDGSVVSKEARQKFTARATDELLSTCWSLGLRHQWRARRDREQGQEFGPGA
jgi:hypothetical protein